MKAKSLVTVIAVILLCGGASAQGYSIRITYNSNLRAAASLSARIVETVPSGTTLHVVGNNNRWLRINRNGSEVWIADWVGYTRVENSQQTNTQTSQIDNCCFVDRQCATDEEWTSGYWAFQNKQCAAPAQSRQQPASQPASNLSSSADNCCFLDWQCNTDAEWQNGYWAFQNNQCPAPVRYPAVVSQRPIVEGTEVFVRRVNNALDWLQGRATDWYAYVISGMDKIGQSSLYGISYARLGERATYISQSHAFRGEGRIVDYMILCSTLVHEASHHYDHDAGLVIEGWDGEIRAEQKQLEFYNAVDPYGQYEVINYLKRGLVLEIISMERGWLASQLNQGH